MDFLHRCSHFSGALHAGERTRAPGILFLGVGHRRSRHLGFAAGPQVIVGSATAALIYPHNSLQTTHDTSQPVTGVELGQRDVFLLGSCPRLASHSLVRLSAGKCPILQTWVAPAPPRRRRPKTTKGGM